MEFGNITLFREKSVVYRFVDSDEEDAPTDEPVLSLRSNRVTIPVKTKLSTVSVVVRGQNIPSTMRMTAVVLDEIRRDSNVLVDGGAADWNGSWLRRLSKYEADYNRENWVSVHIAGDEIYASRDDNAAIREIESLALNVDVTDDIVMETAHTILGALDDYAVEHDSQTAFSLVPGAANHRASILERRDRKTGATSISAIHPTPQTPVRLSAFMSFCADIMEAMTIKSFLDRVQEMAVDNVLTKSGITPTQVTAARTRHGDILKTIDNFEQANKVAYRPERPKLR